VTKTRGPARVKRRGGARKHKSPASTRAEVPLDEIVCRAYIAFMLLAYRCGYEGGELSRLYEAVNRWMPESIGDEGSGSNANTNEAAHVLALWIALKEYQLKGRPRSLPLAGPEPSVEALVRRVDANLSVSKVADQLLEEGSIKRVGHRYIVLKREVIYRHARSLYAHQMRATLVFLQSHDHNGSAEARWLNRIADAPQFPVAALPAARKYVMEQVGDCITNLNLYLVRRESKRAPGEPTVRVAGGVYWAEDEIKQQSPQFESILEQVLSAFRLTK
jgi:hypothetical protein